jgi:hypothetical protein
LEGRCLTISFEVILSFVRYNESNELKGNVKGDIADSNEGKRTVKGEDAYKVVDVEVVVVI